jgi:hypothetical protein
MLDDELVQWTYTCLTDIMLSREIRYALSNEIEIALISARRGEREGPTVRKRALQAAERPARKESCGAYKRGGDPHLSSVRSRGKTLVIGRERTSHRFRPDLMESTLDDERTGGYPLLRRTNAKRPLFWATDCL